MKTTVLFSVCVFLTVDSVLGDYCGGLLEGEQGHFSLADAAHQEQHEPPNSSCLWIIQLHYENNIRFTLNTLDKDTILNLYPEAQLTSCNLSDHTKLNSTQIGSSFEFLGKTLIVILPKSSASVSFSWHYINKENKNSSVTIMKNSDYISSQNGLLEWVQLEHEERVTWGINSNKIFNIKWDLDLATSCDAIYNCACFHFAIFQLTSVGVLSEAVRTCGQSSEGKLEGVSGRVVVLIKVNTKVDANKVAVSWGLDDATVTETPVTEPPATVPPAITVPPASGLFAATTIGLIYLNLQTLEPTPLTSEHATAVAVNHNLRKIYWSESLNNCRIMRSDFNGSAREIIVPPTGGFIAVMAVHELSGNIYFSVQHSDEITICNALGENCGAVISSSSLANDPWSIAFDYDNNVMYWSNIQPDQASLIRADLDGSSVTKIASGFTSGIITITLAQPFNDTLYWADYCENTIGSIDVHGSNKRTIVELESNTGPRGIQFDVDKFYFSSWHEKSIQSFDRDSGEYLATIFNSTGEIRHLALFSEPA